MRERIMYTLSAIGVGLVTWTLYKVFFFVLPAEANVAAYQILYFHVPAAFTAFTGFFTALAASGLYLKTGALKYDAFAAGVTEVAVAFASIHSAPPPVWGPFASCRSLAWDAPPASLLPSVSV